MADGRGRSAQEREAARLERERQRALREGRPWPDGEAEGGAGRRFQRFRPAPGDNWEPRAPHDGEVAVPGDDGLGPDEEPLDHADEDLLGPHAEPLDHHEDLLDAHTAPVEHDEDLFDAHTAPVEHDEDLFDAHKAPLDPQDDGLAPPIDEKSREVAAGTRRVSRLEHPPQPRTTTGKDRLRIAQRGGSRHKHSRIGRIASLIALVLGAALIWFLVELFQPFHGSPHGKITVTIPAHSTSSQIGKLLARDGVISSSFFFELRATLDGQRSDLRAGTYHLQLGMAYSRVLSVLTTPPPAAKVTELTISEGQTRAAVDKLLRSQHVRGSYLAATRSSKLLDPRRYGARRRPGSLEGFLFPSTYQLIDPVQISALVADQLKTFSQRFATVDLRYARRQHLTPYDVLIIASLIESETPTSHDRPLVSSVIYNRLADGMPLQLDSTTRYATGNLHGALTVSELNSGSPYNTRVHKGLPPTPIDSPGMASIQAAAHPARTNYLYFFAKPCSTGSVFASNYNQFLALGRRYAAKRC